MSSLFPLGTEVCGVPPSVKSVFLDSSYFARLWPEIYPPSYLEPLVSPGPGYEVLQAYAKVFERISLALARLDAGCHILESLGGALANGYVEITRLDNSAGDTIIRAGTVVSTSRGGRQYVTLQDVAFIGAALGPLSVQIAAVRPGYEFNVPGQKITADGTLLPGDVDTVETLDAYLSPSGDRFFGSPPFTVTNVTPICGGRPQMLDGLGADLSVSRNEGEPDSLYAQRLRTLGDTVSPLAIQRAVDALFLPYGYSVGAGIDLIETWSSAYQTAYDVDGSIPGIDDNLFCYDDPRPAYPPFRNRWYGEEDVRGAFIVVVPNLGAISDVGMAYDDTATGPTATSLDTGGARAISAFDVSSTTPVQQGGYDGFDLAKQGVYKSLYDLLDRIKAAGVFFAVELAGQ